MKTLCKLLLGLMLILLASSAPAGAEGVVVIVGSGSGLTALTRKQVADIYLGRAQRLPDGVAAQALESGNETLRGSFYQSLTGRPVAQIDAYWARLYFAGQQTPPRRLADDGAVIRQVARQKGAIGFIAPASLGRAEGVAIVLRLE